MDAIVTDPPYALGEPRSGGHPHGDLGGTVLDPFLGSGSTVLAAQNLGFDWIGIEQESAYISIAKQRTQAVD